MTVHQPTEAESVAAILARAAGRHFGGNAVIEQLRRESGGASRQTWSFDAVVEDARHELILRRDPPTLGAPAPHTPRVAHCPAPGEGARKPQPRVEAAGVERVERWRATPTFTRAPSPHPILRAA